jgi:hypothetical protein
LTLLKFNSVRKDRLFYNQYQYAVTFHMAEVTTLKNLSHSQIDTRLDRRKQWRETLRTRSQKSNLLSPWAKSWDFPEINEEIRNTLHELCDFLILSDSEHKLVTSVNRAWIYTNDVLLLERFDRFPGIGFKYYSRAMVDRPCNSVLLKHSDHRYRSYFRTLKLDATQAHNLRKFLQQQTLVRLSPALTRWTQDEFSNRTMDYYFVDYPDCAWTTMVGLVCPSLIRKTVDILIDK